MRRGHDPHEHRLARRAAAGDDAAFAELYGRYARRVRAYVGAALRDADAAQDAAQEVFERMYAGLPRFQARPGTPLWAWVFGIAGNVVNEERRRRRRTQPWDPAWIADHRDRTGEAREPHDELTWGAWALRELAPHVRQLSRPTVDARPFDIAVGADGALWFSERAANRIPKANSNPGGIGPGPDSRMYFTETSGNRLGAVTTDFVGPGGGGGPGAAGVRGGSTPPGAAIARLTVRTGWHRLRGRWWLWVRGVLAPARGVARANACGGRRVEVRLRRGRSSVGLRRVRATRRCAYAARLPYGRAAARRRGRLSVVVRLPGLSRPAPVVRAVPLPRALTRVR